MADDSPAAENSTESGSNATWFSGETHSDISSVLLESLRIPIHAVDMRLRVVYWNQPATRQTGYRSAEVMGKVFNQDVLETTDLTERPILPTQCPLSTAIRTAKPASLEVHIRRRDGLRVPFSLSASPLWSKDREVIGAVAVWVDIRNNIDYLQDQADAFRRLKQLENADYNDLLTGLPNRRSAESRLVQAVKRLEEDNAGFGVLLFDIDHFKNINAHNQRSIGDYALRGVATVLRSALRGNDMLFRWGGDKFLALVNADEAPQLEVCAERCRVRVQDNRWNEVEHCPSVTVSAGGAMALPTDSINSLLQRADEQLYQAKKAGRNRALVDRRRTRF